MIVSLFPLLEKCESVGLHFPRGTAIVSNQEVANFDTQMTRGRKSEQLLIVRTG